MVALSVHALFEGIIVGTAKSVSTVWLLTAIVVAHKWAEGFAIASQLTPEQRNGRMALVLLGIFCMAAPIGASLGWIVDAVSEASTGDTPAFLECLLNSLAVGTLLYIGMVEVVPEEFTGTHHLRSKYLTLIVAAVVVLGLTLLHIRYGHGESHNHAEGGDHSGHQHLL